MAWVATAVIGSAVIGAGASIYGANKAADAQTQAADNAANTQLDMYNTTRGDLLPYNQAGQQALNSLKGANYYTQDIPITDPSNILADPNSIQSKAYDFTKTQGLKAVQNSAAARGLGSSGAALKGAASFATGLADNTYQNLWGMSKDVFNMGNINNTNAFNRLQTIVSGGQNAAAQTGTAGASAATGASNAQIGAGNAQAAGWNATGGAINTAANNVGGYAAYKGLYGGNGGGGWSQPTGAPLAPSWYSQ